MLQVCIHVYIYIAKVKYSICLTPGLHYLLGYHADKTDKLRVYITPFKNTLDTLILAPNKFHTFEFIR